MIPILLTHKRYFLNLTNMQRRKWQPKPIFLPKKSHGQRSLVGYSMESQETLTRLSNKTTEQWLTCCRNLSCCKSCPVQWGYDPYWMSFLGLYYSFFSPLNQTGICALWKWEKVGGSCMGTHVRIKDFKIKKKKKRKESGRNILSDMTLNIW